MRFSIIGLGYVGLSLAVLLSERYPVTIYDTNSEKMNKVLKKQSPIQDVYIEKYLKEKKLLLKKADSLEEAVHDKDFVILALPTDYDVQTQSFDTSALDEIFKTNLDGTSTVVIKSTIPPGYTQSLREKGFRVLFSPEFLRETHALYDNLFPSRIIVGCDDELKEQAQIFAESVRECTCKENVPVEIMGTGEAECVKLFSNTYLALRVAFFNELDTYADLKGLDAGSIIRGVCLDPRIGNFYNNPSFGYGGYCLPKDTKQMLANYRDVPNDIIQAVVSSNQTRKDFIAKRVYSKIQANQTVGIYRLTMKKGSDNFRSSSILGIIQRLQKEKVSILIYEPLITEGRTEYGMITHNWNTFTREADIVLANRYDEQLEKIKEKVYTRDIFQRDE